MQPRRSQMHGSRLLLVLPLAPELLQLAGVTIDAFLHARRGRGISKLLAEEIQGLAALSPPRACELNTSPVSKMGSKGCTTL
jgi:hypothetical protein